MCFVGAVVVVDEEGGLYVAVFGMVVDELQALVETHDHECRGHGVGIPRGGADHRDTEQRVADGQAGGGVDGVGVADAVLFVVFAVVAGGDNGEVGELDDGFDGLFAVFVFGGALYADGPLLVVGFEAAGDYFASDVDHVVVDAAVVEHLGYEVDGIALCDGVEVEFDEGVFVQNVLCGAVEGGAVDGVGVGTEEGEACVDLALGYGFPFFEAEAVEVDQRADATVEGAMGVEVDLLRFVEDVIE